MGRQGREAMEQNGQERIVRDAVLAGDMEAWRAWFAATFEPLAAYARWRCGGLADLADDVIQETWLTVVRRLRSFDPARGTFFQWVCGIASNSARNAVRARNRRRLRSRSLSASDDVPAAEPDVAADEKAERVALALAALPEHYEAVLRAKYLDRLTVAQIATIRNETLKAVESLLSRARQAFREAYGSHSPPTPLSGGEERKTTPTPLPSGEGSKR